jgi:glutathione S-transferase
MQHQFLPVDVFAMKQRQFVVGDRVTVADFAVAYTLDRATDQKPTVALGEEIASEAFDRIGGLRASSCRLNPLPGARSRALAGRPLR